MTATIEFHSNLKQKFLNVFNSALFITVFIEARLKLK